MLTFKPFQYFLDGFCRYVGDLLEHLENIPSIGVCQMACSHDTQCKYWVYDKDTHDCELLADDRRECDISRGPPTPTINACFPPNNTPV